MLPSPSVLTAPGSPVAAVTFCRLECDHHELFQPEYKRSNRTKGLKILRCFPHCCPSHMERSYCGSSLHVLVRTTKPLPQLQQQHATTQSPSSSSSEPHNALNIGDLAVFARFESSTGPGLEPGECVSIDSIAAGTQSEENPEGQWIPGIYEPPQQQSTSDHALVFQLNGKIYSRWYYDWESGANKAQRLMKHVLKAYVLEQCGVNANGQLLDCVTATAHAAPESVFYRVAAIIVSPEFTVISYRRAPNELIGGSSDVGGVLSGSGSSGSSSVHRDDVPALYPGHQQAQQATRQALARPPSPTTIYTEHPRHHKRPLGTIDDALPPRSKEHNSDDSMEPRGSHKRRRPMTATTASIDSFVRPSAPATSWDRLRRSSSSSSSTNAFEDRVLWEHAHASAAATSKNLALLFWFAQWTPLATNAPFVDELVHITHRRLLAPLATLSTPQQQQQQHPVAKINCFSRVLLERATASSTTTTTTARVVLPYELEALLRVMAQATLWFYAPSTRQWIRAFFQQHATATLDKHVLRASFLLWLHEFESRLNHDVLVMTPLKSVTVVAEEIISAVYSYERFHTKRTRVRQVLGAQGFAGWHAFVAQLRDAFIASSRAAAASSPPSFLASAQARNTFERGWNSEWLLDMDEAVWKQSDVSLANARAVSLATVYDLISQLGRLEIALGVHERSLRFRAPLHTIALGYDAMHLVLDGRERIFRLFPNGVSSALDNGTTGDYIGSLHMEGTDRVVVYLELFTWALAPNEPSYHTRMRIECWRNHRLYVNGEVLVTVSPSTFTDDERPFVSEMKLRAKRKAVTKAHARQVHAAATAAAAAGGGSGGSGGSGQPPSGQIPPAWKALGRFRLSYHRLSSSAQ